MKNVFKCFFVVVFLFVCSSSGNSALLEPEWFVYVAINDAAGGIIELNTKTHALTTIPTNAKAYSSVISPDGKFLYTCYPEADTVTAIRLSDHSIVSTISVGDYPSSLAITPDGRFLYVVNQTSKDVSVIDTATNTEITSSVTRIPVGNTPYAIAIRPQGDIAYVLNVADINISIINLSDNSVVNTIDLSASSKTWDLVFSPDGQFAYVIDSSNHELYIIDVINSIEMTPSTPLPQYVWSMAVSPDGKTLYAGRDAYSSIEIVDLTVTPPLKTISVTPLLSEVRFLAFLPDGKKLYYYYPNDAILSFLDIPTNKEAVASRVEAGHQLHGAIAVTPSIPLVQAHSYRTDFFTDSDVYNTVSWSQPVSAFPLHYEIYRDKALTQLAKSIPCDVPGNCQRTYEEHDLLRHKIYEYYVVAKNDYGIVSIGSASITTG